MPFQFFVRYVSKHLPREVQSIIMTRDIANINELEHILDILQNIRNREINKRQIRDNGSRNSVNEHNQVPRADPRGRVNENNWLCMNRQCGANNYGFRRECYKCGSFRGSFQDNRGFDNSGYNRRENYSHEFRGRGGGFVSNRGMPGGTNSRGRGGYSNNGNESRGADTYISNQNSRIDHRRAYAEPSAPAQLN